VPELEVSFVKERIMNQLSYDVRNSRLLELGFSPAGDMTQEIGRTIDLLRQSNSG
jgi:hypothetical protein